MVRKFSTNNVRFPIVIFVVSLVAYLYLFTFIVWNEFSLYEVANHTEYETFLGTFTP